MKTRITAITMINMQWTISKTTLLMKTSLMSLIWMKIKAFKIFGNQRQMQLLAR